MFFYFLLTIFAGVFESDICFLWSSMQRQDVGGANGTRLAEQSHLQTNCSHIET